MGNVVNMKRQTGDPSQEIQEGLEEYEEIRLSSFEQEELTADQVRARFNQKRRPWDPVWGGRCPYEISEDEKRAMARRSMEEAKKPALIDRLMPCILIIGFFGFIYLCVWLGYLLMGVAD